MFTQEILSRYASELEKLLPRFLDVQGTVSYIHQAPLSDLFSGSPPAYFIMTLTHAVLIIPDDAGLLPSWYSCPGVAGRLRLNALHTELLNTLYGDSIPSSEKTAVMGRITQLRTALATAGVHGNCSTYLFSLQLYEGHRNYIWLIDPVESPQRLELFLAPVTPKKISSAHLKPIRQLDNKEKIKEKIEESSLRESITQEQSTTSEPHSEVFQRNPPLRLCESNYPFFPLLKKIGIRCIHTHRFFLQCKHSLLKKRKKLLLRKNQPFQIAFFQKMQFTVSEKDFPCRDDNPDISHLASNTSEHTTEKISETDSLAVSGRHIPVHVSVMLAKRRMRLAEILGLEPGMLIFFPKKESTVSVCVEGVPIGEGTPINLEHAQAVELN